MADTYENFAELAAQEREGEAWRRTYRPRASRFLIMAPHGGKIERFTSELARYITQDDLSFYAFQGLKVEGNRALHLTSHRFDEPLALEAASQAGRILAIHGERSRERAFVMVGGGWGTLREKLRTGLEEVGIHVHVPRAGLLGENPMNICNRGREGAGGQLEVSYALRRILHGDREALDRFSAAVRKALLEFESGPGDRRRMAPQPPGWNSRPLGL